MSEWVSERGKESERYSKVGSMAGARVLFLILKDSQGYQSRKQWRSRIKEEGES